MPTVNVTPNYDYESQTEDLKRRQAIIDAMAAQASAPIAMPQQGAVQARINPLQPLLQMAQAVMARQQNGALKQEKADFAAKQNADLRTGVENYLQTSQGGQEKLPPDVQGPPQTFEPNPRKAMLDALAANHPILRQLGLQQLAGAGKETMTPKDILSLSGYDAASKLDAARGRDITKLKPEQYSDPSVIATDPDGRPIFGQRAPNGKVNWAPPGQHVTVNTGQKTDEAFGKNIVESQIKTLDKSYEVAKQLPAKLQILDSAANNLSAGIKSGLTANIGLTFAKLGQSLGMGEVDPTIANTEAYRSQMANSVLDVLKTLRPASDKDVEYAQKAAGGDITLAQESMLRLINEARAAAGNALVQHDTLLNDLAETAGPHAKRLKMYEVPWGLKFKAGNGLNWDEKSGRFLTELPPTNKKPSISNW